MKKLKPNKMVEGGYNRPPIKQHRDLLTDPRFRHRKEIVHDLLDELQQLELREYLKKYENDD